MTTQSYTWSNLSNVQNSASYQRLGEAKDGDSNLTDFFKFEKRVASKLKTLQTPCEMSGIEGWVENSGMVWSGVVWFGWLCSRRPSPLPLSPVLLWRPSWEGPLFRSGRRISEWMSNSSGGPLQWRLFVYTRQSRHTSLAAQPTDNLWCPNRQWVCGCPSALSLSGSG